MKSCIVGCIKQQLSPSNREQTCMAPFHFQTPCLVSLRDLQQIVWVKTLQERSVPNVHGKSVDERDVRSVVFCVRAC